MELRSVFFGLVLGALLVGCTSFGYRHYGLDAVSYEGKLLGPDESKDLPLDTCKPDQNTKGKCIVMLQDEFYRMKQMYQDLEAQLADCQKPKL